MRSLIGDAQWRVQHDAIADAFRDHCVHDLGIDVRREVDDLFKQALPLVNTVPMDELKDLVPDAELSLPAFNIVTGSYDRRSLKSTLLKCKTMRGNTGGAKATKAPPVHDPRPNSQPGVEAEEGPAIPRAEDGRRARPGGGWVTDRSESAERAWHDLPHHDGYAKIDKHGDASVIWEQRMRGNPWRNIYRDRTYGWRIVIRMLRWLRMHNHPRNVSGRRGARRRSCSTKARRTGGEADGRRSFGVRQRTSDDIRRPDPVHVEGSALRATPAP
eukprot:jgi/Tetstr1/424269/TSEL_014838.t1